MKLHVTASSSPRAAAVRRIRRSTSCERVAVGFAMPGARSSGVESRSSNPVIRTISSTRSARALDVPSPARRPHLGAIEGKAEALENIALSPFFNDQFRPKPGFAQNRSRSFDAGSEARRRELQPTAHRRRCRGSSPVRMARPAIEEFRIDSAFEPGAGVAGQSEVHWPRSGDALRTWK